MQPLVYLDNQATTRVDPRVLQAMLPYFSERYGNAGSVTHALGQQAREAVERARGQIAEQLGARPEEIVLTSGATESNNLALRGAAQRHGQRGCHLISVQTEHKAILDPLDRLTRQGFEVTLLPVGPQGSVAVGRVDLDQLREAVRPDTILVSVMLANNEVGGIQPIAEIGRLCRSRGILLHCDAAQAVGKMPVDVGELEVDLLSFSAHKLYGPKGVGGLYVRRSRPAVRLTPQMDGGGQEFGLRSGTLNVAGIVGMAEAMAVAGAEWRSDAERVFRLRGALWERLSADIPDVSLNGPPLDDPQRRLPGNLNVCFGQLDGQALMMHCPELAMSSGSACTAANPEPSHVLRALGLGDDQVRCSLRISFGRFNTADDVARAARQLAEAAGRLRAFSLP